MCPHWLAVDTTEFTLNRSNSFQTSCSYCLCVSTGASAVPMASIPHALLNTPRFLPIKARQWRDSGGRWHAPLLIIAYFCAVLTSRWPSVFSRATSLFFSFFLPFSSLIGGNDGLNVPSFRWHHFRLIRVCFSCSRFALLALYRLTWVSQPFGNGAHHRRDYRARLADGQRVDRWALILTPIGQFLFL